MMIPFDSLNFCRSTRMTFPDHTALAPELSFAVLGRLKPLRASERKIALGSSVLKTDVQSFDQNRTHLV